MCKDQFGHGASKWCISYNTHAFVHDGHLGGYTFEACIFETGRVRCNIEEVDILATAVVEVVILVRSRVDGRGSRDLGDGSGTCLSLHEFPKTFMPSVSWYLGSSEFPVLFLRRSVTRSTRRRSFGVQLAGLADMSGT